MKIPQWICTRKIQVRIDETIISEHGDVKRHETNLVETTVGRALLAEFRPEGMPFHLLNEALKKKQISGLINSCYRRLGLKKTVVFADRLMYTGFRFATIAVFQLVLMTWLSRKRRRTILQQRITKSLKFRTSIFPVL